MKHRIIAIFMLIALIVVCFCGCGNMSMGLGSYEFNKVHIDTYHYSGCLEVEKWYDVTTGIEIRTENGESLFSNGINNKVFCENFASLVNTVGDPSCTATNATTTLAFTTPDGIKWSIDGAKNKFTGDGAEVILNVNPDASSVGKTGTQGVDYFIIYVKDYGKIYVNGEKEKEYLKGCEGSECETPSTPDVTPSCPEGQIPNGNACCDDSSPEDGICDTEPETPTCTEGTVLIGDDCCADSNGNNECDDTECGHLKILNASGECVCRPDFMTTDNGGCCRDVNDNGTCDSQECASNQVEINGTCCDDSHPTDGRCDGSEGCSSVGDFSNGGCAYICGYYPNEALCPEYCETHDCVPGSSVGPDCSSDPTASGCEYYCYANPDSEYCLGMCDSDSSHGWCYDNGDSGSSDTNCSLGCQ